MDCFLVSEKKIEHINGYGFVGKEDWRYNSMNFVLVVLKKSIVPNYKDCIDKDKWSDVYTKREIYFN